MAAAGSTPPVDARTLVSAQEEAGKTRRLGEALGGPASGQGSAAGEADAPAPEGELSEAEQKEVRDLEARDREVRAHEQAHARAGGAHAGAPNFEFERGPDGQNYAVGGHVSISTSPVEGDPQATARKMEAVQRAATAPADPSSQDLKVAAEATKKLAAAEQEVRDLKAAEQNEPAEDAEAVEETAAAEKSGSGEEAAVADGRDPESADGVSPTPAQDGAPRDAGAVGAAGQPVPSGDDAFGQPDGGQAGIAAETTAAEDGATGRPAAAGAQAAAPQGPVSDLVARYVSPSQVVVSASQYGVAGGVPGAVDGNAGAYGSRVEPAVDLSV